MKVSIVHCPILLDTQSPHNYLVSYFSLPKTAQIYTSKQWYHLLNDANTPPLMGDSLEKNNLTDNSTLRPFFSFCCESCCLGSPACLTEDPEELELPRQGWDCSGALGTRCWCMDVAVPRLVVKYYDFSHWQRGGQTNKKKFKEKHQTTVSNLNYAGVIEGRPRDLDRNIIEKCIATSVLCLYQTRGRAGKPVLMTCQVKQNCSLSLKENKYGKMPLTPSPVLLQ